jgi:hypothetical protein
VAARLGSIADVMDFTHLVKARAMLFEDSDGWYQKGIFVSLSCDVPTPNLSTLGMADRLTLAVRSIGQYEWNMLTAIERLEWTRHQVDTNEHVMSQWNYYASTDIESWHVNFKSLLDQVALVIAELADRRKQVPNDSFRKLYDRSRPEKLRTVEGMRFAEKLGVDWLGLLHGVTWFDQIVSVRDEIVHSGGHTMVFKDASNAILFQVHGRRYQNLVKNNPLMFNKNVVFFDRYAAHLMSHLLIFLEHFGRVVYDRLLSSRKPEETAKNCSPGWGTLRSWIDSTLAAVAPPGP